MPAIVLPGRRAGFRPRGPFVLNADMAQELGVVAWYPTLPLFRDEGPGWLYPLTTLDGTLATGASPTLGGITASFNGSTGYYRTPPFTGFPLTLAAWAMTTDTANAQEIVALSQFAGNSERTSLAFAGATAGDPVRAVSQTVGAFQIANTTRGYTAYHWHFCTGVWSSTSDRSAYIDGGARGNASGSISTATPDRLSIGTSYSLSARLQPLNGQVAEAVVCNKAWTDAQVWMMFAPASRWSLYWQPGRTLYFDVGAASGTARSYGYIFG
jgi:hypothetical protein